MAFEDNLEFAQSVLDKYFSKPGAELKLTNELLKNRYEFGELMGQAIKVDQGKQIHFDTLIRTGGNVGYVAPGTKREARAAQHVLRGTVPWSFFEGSFQVEETEVMLNEGGQQQLFSLMDTRLEGMLTEAHNHLEDDWFHEVGGMDSWASDERPIAGLKAWVTRHGYHVDGSAEVFGLNVLTDPRWLNRYVGPLGSNLNTDLSHVSGDTITSANALRKMMKKAMRYCKFASVAGLKFAQDDTKKQQLRSQKIWVDEIGYEALEAIQDALGHGRDRISPEEINCPDPTFGGIPIVWIPQLGLGSAGIPTYAKVNTVRGDLSSGGYTYTGELFICNLLNLRMWGHKSAMPLRKKLEFLPETQVLWQLFRWFMNSVCNSRQRQCCIWGFNEAILA